MRSLAPCPSYRVRGRDTVSLPLDIWQRIIIVNHMVNSRTALLDETFFALSDPTRREMVARLAAHDMTVSELAAPFDISPPAVSKHLRVLERAGLLTSDREGRVRRCRLEASALQEAAEWVETQRRFWEDRLDRLAMYLDDKGRQSGESSRGQGEK